MALLWVRQEWDESLNDGQSPGVETVYQVVTDDIEYPILSARIDLLNQLVIDGATLFGGLPISDIKIERLRASKCFRAHVTYGVRSKPEDGKFDFTMDSRPESRRVYVGLAAVSGYARPGATVETMTEILKTNQDAQATGTDLFIPVKTFNVSLWWSTNRFAIGQPIVDYQSLQNYVDLLDSLEGYVNSVFFSFLARGLTFKFQPGECLLAGSRLSQQGADLWQIDIELKKKRNYIDPLLSSWAGTSITVQGWDEIDWQMETVADTPGTKIAARPLSATIKRTYFRGDLNRLKVPVI